ncbi:DUF4232 domain-containing protein [Streptomyces sp. NPDC057616]|uniref:DUF4232 domain-containing protein n=1 Tax=Streptomyces sp. NPDC057616 TaxID=3346183 RepID=UPI00369E53DB
MAVAAVSAAVAVSACQPGGDTADAGSSPSGASTSAGAGPSSAAPSATASKPSGAKTSTAPSASASPVSRPSGASVTTCAPKALSVTAYQAAVRPSGTGTGAAIVEFTNTSAQSCVLKGYPTVAGAANGSPQHNSPLTVTRTGSSSSVRVAPGGKAWVKLTFVQVQGEGDGYCKSGAQPVVYPTMVIGLPGSGQHQVALNDGQFAECDNTATVTAVTAVKPS